VSAGGRVATVVGLGADLAAAHEAAYAAVGRVEIDGGLHRTDIAAREVDRA
jgi:phosphoribosylamine--glycine ligase